MDTIGLQQFGTMKFDRLDLKGIWRNTVGRPTRNFSCLIYGTSGNGKTTAIIDFLKALLDCDLRATYISHEEGFAGTMQDALAAANMFEHYSGRFILAQNATFEETVEYFSKRGSPEIAVIDSIDFCNLTVEQYKNLRKALRKKIIILISWSQGNSPKSQAGKDIEYMVDIKLQVKNFMIWPKSRYGGNTPMAIWLERARMLNPKYFQQLEAANNKKQPKTAQNTPVEDIEADEVPENQIQLVLNTGG